MSLPSRRVRLCDPKPLVRDMVPLARLDGLLEVCADEAETLGCRSVEATGPALPPRPRGPRIATGRQDSDIDFGLDSEENAQVQRARMPKPVR
jgi:hypothetical protein